MTTDPKLSESYRAVASMVEDLLAETDSGVDAAKAWAICIEAARDSLAEEIAELTPGATPSAKQEAAAGAVREILKEDADALLATVNGAACRITTNPKATANIAMDHAQIAMVHAKHGKEAARFVAWALTQGETQ